MKSLYVLLLLSFVGFTGVAQQPAGRAVITEKLVSQERRAFSRNQNSLQARSVASGNFNVNFYRCVWDIDPAVRYISGAVTSYFTITSSTASLTYDLHAALTVDSVRFRNNKLAFQHTANHALTIQLPQTLPALQQDSLTIHYRGVPPDNGFGTFINYTDGTNPVMWTLSEPYGAKDWWPCKNGLNDKADSIEIVINNPALYRSSSNGLLLRDTVDGGRRISVWKHRYPITAYLVAIAVADYDVERDSVGIGATTLPVNMYTYKGYRDYFRHATAITKQCLPKFSQLFGVYPFLLESYSNTQFSWGGGMEHQTNSFITDNGAHLTAHELGHQWFGNKVTCGRWHDIWLNEGFATYMQFIYIENFSPAQIVPHLAFCRDIIVSQPGGSLKVRDTTDIYRMFDSRVTYTKGSAVVHMIRWRLGDSLFFEAIRRYLNDPAITYGYAETADLQRNLEAASGQDFSEFFRDWYEGEGYPSYAIKWAENKNGWVGLRVNQTTSHPSVPFFEMPIPVLLRGAGRDSVFVLNHTQNGQEFWLNPGFKPDTIIFDPRVWLLSANNSVSKVTAFQNDNNYVDLYPNPVDTRVNVSFRNPTGERISLRILNTAGQLMYQTAVETPGRDEIISIPAASFAPGVYWLQIADNKGFRTSRKILKK